MKKRIITVLSAFVICITSCGITRTVDATNFPDVHKGDWYYGYVTDVSEKGYITGYADGKFGATDNLTRGQFATILYRMEESPGAIFKGSFPDVPRGQFYTQPAEWANKEGLITGYATGAFGPVDNLTREQLATIMYRYAKWEGQDVSNAGSLTKFPDGSKVSAFAEDAMEWAVGEGIISGNADGTLAPQGTVSRAVAATIISRYTSDEDEKNEELFPGYRLIEVDGGNLSGHRESKVVVDIGFGEREYWAFTNEYGQLVRVIADRIILQDPESEPVNSSGRYYDDEAKVPGVEAEDLDEGHVIADSLGGVSNAYNITPQNSTLNRYGDQAYMEKVIRDAGGATDFEAVITYPNTRTQIPSHYKYSYTINGNKIVDSFDNVNPDESNKENDISWIDTNGNGIVTIAEAKAAGFKMPITKEHWLYQYMVDADGDGIIGE